MSLSAKQVKELAIQLGFDSAGIARPQTSEALIWAKAVLVLMHATLDEAFDHEMFIEYEGRRKWYKPIYTAIESLSARLAECLRAEGHQASHLTFQDSLALIDLKRAAVEAGLGTLGKNNLVVNRRFGPRMRFGAVFVDAHWPFDSPLLDYYCPSCSLCWKACPSHALGPGGLIRERCLAEYQPSPSMADWQQRIEKRPTPCTRAQCTACITSCPIGSKTPANFYRNIVES